MRRSTAAKNDKQRERKNDNNDDCNGNRNNEKERRTRSTTQAAHRDCERWWSKTMKWAREWDKETKMKQNESNRISRQLLLKEGGNNNNNNANYSWTLLLLRFVTFGSLMSLSLLLFHSSVSYFEMFAWSKEKGKYDVIHSFSQKPKHSIQRRMFICVLFELVILRLANAYLFGEPSDDMHQFKVSLSTIVLPWVNW